MNSIQDFRGLHRGKRVFILASGPSLAEHDLSPLDRRITMGLNRSFLTYAETNYHCAFDQRLFDMYPDETKATRYLMTLPGRPWGIPIELLGADGFSYDLKQGIYSGYTISFFALQVAVYLGFQDIIFLGLDLCHQGNMTHFFGEDWHSRNHETSEFPKMAQSFSQWVPQLLNDGIDVWNCSPYAQIDAIPHLDYADALNR